jgi:hydrocephalus-inducing protein
MHTLRLVFDVRGEGTLPRVTIKEPKLRNANGHAKATFSKLLVGKSQNLPLVVCNTGILPATVRFGQRIGEWPPAENQKDWKEGPKCFQFDGKGAELFLQPGEERAYTVSFRPKSVGAEGKQTFNGCVEMIVHSNEYERNLIELEGVAFTQDVSFDNMPAGSEDAISFGNIPVGVQKTMNFTLSNNSDNIYRFVWEPEASGLLSFSPSVGHIHAHETKEITVTVYAKDKTSVELQEVPLKIQQIVYKDEANDWDDSMKEVEWITDDAVLANETGVLNVSEESEAGSPNAYSRAGRGRKNKPKKVTRVKPEPEYERVLVGEAPEEGAEDVGVGRAEGLDQVGY